MGHQKNIPGRPVALAFILSLWLYSANLLSQSPFQYIWPIDSPFVITGNYGELRPNHFHAGIDFSTGGKMNLPVYAIEEGYVSRIRVGPYGYGKCVYITHPNGKVSVYAHLNAFSLKIANLAKHYQYSKLSFEIDSMPKPRSLYVRRNEIIGLSGNTGGSTGPHLHFEIRDEQTEIPLNPLAFYRLSDSTPPEIFSVGIYDLADTSAPKFIMAGRAKKLHGDSLYLENDHIEVDRSHIGLAFSGIDRIYPGGNPNNIFSTRVYVDEELVYTHTLRGIAFSDSRFINEFSEVIKRTKYQKCFLPTVYPDGIYGTCVNKGRIQLRDDAFHTIKLVVSDEAGNTNCLRFYLRAKQLTNFSSPVNEGDVYIACGRDTTVRKNGIVMTFPAKTLFYSRALLIDNALEAGNKLIILPEANLRQAVNIGFKIPENELAAKEKLVLKRSSTVLPGKCRNDSVFFSLKEFGIYNLLKDTVPPKIKIKYTEKQLKQAWLMDSFSFGITDNLSGIGKYNLWLNNAWVVAEYDAKEDLLTYYFDDDTPIGLLQFKLEVEDKVGNKTVLEYVLKK